MVYAKVSEAGGEAAVELLELYLPLPVGVAAWAAGDKDPIAAAGIVRAQIVGKFALLGQHQAVDVRV